MIGKIIGKIVRFPSHRLVRCHPDCDGCMFCDGGLAACATCGGAEASLPMHCPGVRMDMATCDAVQAGRVDYHDGQWLMTTGQPWLTRRARR